jgi:hypothetical protein
MYEMLDIKAQSKRVREKWEERIKKDVCRGDSKYLW